MLNAMAELRREGGRALRLLSGWMCAVDVVAHVGVAARGVGVTRVMLCVEVLARRWDIWLYV